MKLTATEREGLHHALISAFPTTNALRRMLSFGLDKNLDEIASVNNNLSDIVFELIRWSEATGKTRQLVSAALEDSPQNEELVALAQIIAR
jgi:hypothetical protein